MKKRLLLIALLVLAALLSCHFFLSENGSANQRVKENVPLKSQNTPSKDGGIDSKDKTAARWKDLFSNPINFWGRVVDVDGNPIPNASITAYVRSNLDWGASSKGGKKVNVRSNQLGLFEVSNEIGAGIGIKVESDGYVAMVGEEDGKDLSRVNFSYGIVENGLIQKRPSKSNPHVFVLRKKPNPNEIKFHKTEKRINLSPKGEPTRVTLPNELTLVVTCSSEAPDPFNYDPYNWHGIISISGAELKKIEGYACFLAPDEGYQPSFEIDMSKERGNDWKRVGKADLWFRTDNQLFGKIQISIHTGRKHFFNAKLVTNIVGGKDLGVELNDP